MALFVRHANAKRREDLTGVTGWFHLAALVYFQGLTGKNGKPKARGSVALAVTGAMYTAE